jgi:hypothetical protein
MAKSGIPRLCVGIGFVISFEIKEIVSAFRATCDSLSCTRVYRQFLSLAIVSRNDRRRRVHSRLGAARKKTDPNFLDLSEKTFGGLSASQADGPKSLHFVVFVVRAVFRVAQ